MARLTGLAMLSAVFVVVFGCTRRADNRPCSSLGALECPNDPGCVLESGCCGPPVCVAKGSPPPPLHQCNCPLSCAGLDEASCKTNSACRADYCVECSCTPTFVGCVAAGAPPTMCPVLGCDPPLCGGCNGLDEKSCIAAEPTLGCTPDYCPDCHGGNTYIGCNGPNQGKGACPLACTAGCHSNSDCSGGQICFAPGEIGCGICAAFKSCSSDSNCATGEVCDLAACSCTGGLVCTPACTATSCPAGESCRSDGHCAPIACTTAAQCPADFDCVLPPGDTTGNPYCARIGCNKDSDCGGGYCVKSACYGTLGMCTYPPA